MDAAILELITVVKRLNATSVDSSDIFNTISSRLDIINQCIQLNKALVTLLSVNDTAFRNLSSIPEEPVVDSSKLGFVRRRRRLHLQHRHRPDYLRRQHWSTDYSIDTRRCLWTVPGPRWPRVSSCCQSSILTKHHTSWGATEKHN